ncbi:response regulator [Rubritalea spongiae]|uniref:Response regulator n=1 Tax=Rubritalea spongiae TaxID=430797 RepID=A0ABW5E634_9BACT
MIPIDLWIVEDDANYRRTLQRMMEREEQLTCTGVFPSCVEMLQAVECEKTPDLILMDLGLPEMSGVEGIRRLSEVAPDVAVLVLTVAKEKEKVFEALSEGAAGYLLKSASREEILNGIEQVFMGQAALSPEVATLVLSKIRKPTPAENYDLSEKEVEVLRLLSEGMAVKEIADAMGVSRGMAAFHLGKIYSKLQVQSQTGAVAKALRSGVI